MGWLSVEGLRRRAVRWLEDNRGLVIVLFCLPASLIFDYVHRSLQFVQKKLFASVPHQVKVLKVQKAVREWGNLPEENRKPMVTSRPTWLSLSTTFFPKHECHQIPMGGLVNVVEIDDEKRTVDVEPSVSVKDVTAYLIPRGYTLAVTLEIGDATCGGLAMAVGMTTHSHKVGLYQEAVESYEVVLADGSVVTATRDNEYRDLFLALPWSHGTLAFLVSLKLRIIPAKPYVHVQYIPVQGLKNYCDTIRDLSGALNPSKLTADFIEATVFSEDEAVIMVGNFADVTTKEQKEKINIVTRWYKPWFYKHVESFVGKKGEEFIPVGDYLLRHNRAIFWVLESLIPFGNNPIFRLFLGWLCPPKPAFLKLTTTQGVRELTITKQVFQDVVLPMTVLEESVMLAKELFDTFPLLIYPCRIYDHGPHSGQLRTPKPEQMTPGANYGMFYDLGIYGVPGPVKRKEKYEAVKTMRKLEKFIREVGGYSFLYADIFMDQVEFGEMFDLSLYERVRFKYGADTAFPHLYKKVAPEIDIHTLGE